MRQEPQQTGGWLRLIFGAVLTALMLPDAAAAAPPPQAVCAFELGFQTIHDLIGPAIVGDCLENQRFAANGNAEQRSTGGLMVWRKADNWTAFTDGYRSWVNGPDGLQIRLNTQCFPWETCEQTPPPSPPPPPPTVIPAATAVPAPAPTAPGPPNAAPTPNARLTGRFEEEAGPAHRYPFVFHLLITSITGRGEVYGSLETVERAPPHRRTQQVVWGTVQGTQVALSAGPGRVTPPSSGIEPLPSGGGSGLSPDVRLEGTLDGDALHVTLRGLDNPSPVETRRITFRRVA